MTADLKELKSKLKQEHGVDIHQFSIAGLTFLFRPLTISELELANNEHYKFFELEDQYVKAVTLYPEDVDWDDLEAGYVAQYVDNVLKVSGFDDINIINEMLTKHRNRAQNNILFLMKSHIITAMPAYKEEDFDDLSMDEIVEKLVMAETILSIQTTMGTEYYSPDAFKLYITEPGEEPQVEIREERPKARKPINPLDSPIVERRPNMSDEEYEQMRKDIIQKIIKQNRNTDIVDPTKMVSADYSKLKDMPLDKLKAMAGFTREDDPIARKLLANRNSERRAARALGLPYND